MASTVISRWVGLGLLVAGCGDATANTSEGSTSEAATGDTTPDVPTTDGPTTDGPTTDGPGTDGPGTDTATDTATDSGGGELEKVEVLGVSVAQTHVLVDGERTWDLKDTASSLHVVGGRSFLALLELGAAAPTEPVLEVLVDDVVVGTVAIDPPGALPPTEAGGPAFATNLHSATVDAAWVRPGLSLRVTAEGAAASVATALPVGVDSDFDMWTLPFYLFGANDENSAPIEVTGVPDAASKTELYQKWPIARVNFAQHPAQRVDWPTIVIGPRNGLPAQRVENADQPEDSFAVMGAVLGVLGAVRRANGESSTNNQIYAPLLMLTEAGEYKYPGGGLGGGSLGTGDYDYAGVFIHEQGHAFGMPHAADGYANEEYPYIGGSLVGSMWGYDAARREFLAPFIAPEAETFASCMTDDLHKIDEMDRCVKQDPMQSGAGDQAPGYKYTLFSDFNASVIQRYFEGVTELDDNDLHAYSGGVIFVDAASSTGYSRWDSLDLRRVEVAVETTNNGLDGLDGGLPFERDVPVHTIIFTLSAAGTANASQIYPPLSFQGNLRRQIDPTAPADLAMIVPNTGDIPWYCHAGGCDYTLRVTYADQQVRHVLIQSGFRPWFEPMGEPEAATQDPTNDGSFRVFAVNVPGDKAWAKLEVLATPMGWNGVPNGAEVLLSRGM